MKVKDILEKLPTTNGAVIISKTNTYVINYFLHEHIKREETKTGRIISYVDCVVMIPDSILNECIQSIQVHNNNLVLYTHKFSITDWLES